MSSFTFKHKIWHIEVKGVKYLGKEKGIYELTELMWLWFPLVLQNNLGSCSWPFGSLTSPVDLKGILFCPKKLPGVRSILEVHLLLLLKCHFAFGIAYRKQHSQGEKICESLKISLQELQFSKISKRTQTGP